MKSAWLLSAGLAAASVSMSVSAQNIDFDKVQIVADQMAPNLTMLSGSAGLDPSHDDAAGGRIGVLSGPDGILMVDAQYAQLTDKVTAAIRRISAAPIRFLVNTHIHRDHTAGNANFARMGAVIFAREELREGMVRISQSPNASSIPLSDPAGFPVVTYGMGAAGDNSHGRRNHRPYSGASRPHRRRHDHPFRERQRDHDRRFLSQLRLSLHRHQKRRLAEGHAGSARYDDETRRSGYQAGSWPRHHHQARRYRSRIAT